jgi:hypothetical protein
MTPTDEPILIPLKILRELAETLDRLKKILDEIEGLDTAAKRGRKKPSPT